MVLFQCTECYTQNWYDNASLNDGSNILRVDYKFNIVNMEKPTSEFSRGMRPLFYSEKDATQSGLGWVRCGRDICYYPNQFAKKSDPTRTFYTLSFTVQFPHVNDTSYFSVNYPYTVSMWKHHLAYIMDGRYPQFTGYLRTKF